MDGQKMALVAVQLPKTRNAAAEHKWANVLYMGAIGAPVINRCPPPVTAGYIYECVPGGEHRNSTLSVLPPAAAQ